MIAIFASGSGSNAVKIITHCHTHHIAQVALLCTDNPQAAIIEKAQALGVEVAIFHKPLYQEGAYLAHFLQSKGITLIVLAGYLKFIPVELITAYPQKIINIHPSLLPKFGGKGMYGLNVHKAVIAAGETESGITIHYVNEEYDKGEILLQEKIHVQPEWTPEELQQAVLAIEHKHYPLVVEKVWKEMEQVLKQ